MTLALALRQHKAGLVLAVHVVPRASRTELVGLYGDAVRVRVKAPPSEGAANAALLAYLAQLLGLPEGNLELIAGQLSRHKLVLLRGLAAETARHRLETALSGTG